jgi:hypothetical protein
MAAFKSKEYYEEELQRKVLYVPNLSMYLVKLHEQILKLPHESYDAALDANVGMTYNDIVQSFCNGVDLLFEILQPIRSMAGPKYPKCPVEDSTTYKLALKKLGWCYGLMDDMDVLNDRVVTVDMPDENELYDTEVSKDVQAVGTLPAPEPVADDGAVGALEGKDEQRVAEAGVAEGVLPEPERYRDTARAAGFR